MIAGPDGRAWLDAAEKLGDRTLSARVVSPTDLVDGAAWFASAGIEAGGALLVRPDQHVAWRSRRDVADAEATLRSVLQRVLEGGT